MKWFSVKGQGKFRDVRDRRLTGRLERSEKEGKRSVETRRIRCWGDKGKTGVPELNKSEVNESCERTNGKRKG